MSVIFETLQKLNRPAVESDAEEGAGRPRRNVYALKSVLMSPVAVLLMTLVVFGLGYGLVYGLRQVQRSTRMDPTVLAAAREPSAVAVPVADPPQDVPPPPDVRHLETVGAPAPPALDQPVFAGPEVAPPSAEEMAALEGEAVPGGQTASWHPPASNSWASAPPTGISFSASTPSGETTGYSDYAPPAVAPAEKRPSVIDTEGPPQAGVAFRLSGRERPAAQTGSAALPDRHPLYSASDENDALADVILTEARPETAAAPRTIKRKPIPRYTRLVNRLQTAIVTGDKTAADELLGDFAAIKGKSHPYIIKLKAFRHLQTGDYAAAEVLLGQVLALDKGDRDAQVNMAVVEANTGRADAARRRLARLVERFPDDETLAAMGRQLN